MNGRDAARRERWAATRARGKTRFVLQYGVLAWGVTTALIWTLVMALWQGWERFWMHLGIALVVFPLAGIFWGVWMWHWSERSHRRSAAPNLGDEGSGVAASVHPRDEEPPR
jgi:hypothetical protein